MEPWAPTPHPIATLLLTLEARGDSGIVELGTRRIRVRAGRIAAVDRAPEDRTFVAHLLAAGRIDGDRAARLSAAGLDGDAAETALLEGRAELAGVVSLSVETLRETLRGAWLDRLVRILDQQEVRFRPGAVPVGAPDFSMLPLVLDALERRAGGGDADAVGARAQLWLRWTEGPALSRARSWAGLDRVTEARVASVLAQAPAGAARIAALVRAGLVSLVSATDALPVAPAPRPLPVILRGSGVGMPRVVPPKADEPVLPPPPASVPPPKSAMLRLGPGAARVLDELRSSAELLRLPMGDAPLEDPLEDAELRVRSLEDRHAPARARAEAWLAYGDLWLERYAAWEERARAYREAAALVPGDAEVLLRTAEACAAIAEPDLALAYGRAAISAATDEDTRRKQLLDYAHLCRRLGKTEDALLAARAAASVGAPDADAWLLVAQLEGAEGRAAAAAAAYCEAAALLARDEPARAHMALARGYAMRPDDMRCAEALAASFARLGLHDAAVALRAEIAFRETRPAERRRLVLAAGERAELLHRSLLAATLVLDAFDLDPSVDIVHEPLDVDLEAAGARHERTVLLEEIAVLAPSDVASDWWTRAAESRAELEPEGTLEIEFRMRALEHGRLRPKALEVLRQKSERSGEPSLLLDGVERAIRSGAFEPDEVARLKVELGRAADRANQPLRAAWAWGSATNADLESRARDAEAQLTTLERDVEAADESRRASRATAWLRLASSAPEHRRRALLRCFSIVESQYDAELALACESAARADGDPFLRGRAAQVRAQHADKPIEQAKLYIRVSAFERMAGRAAAARTAIDAALRATPRDLEAAIRLRRLADGDTAVERESFHIEATLSQGTQRARAWTEIARIDEARGQVASARDAATDALRADPQWALAALVLLRSPPADDHDPAIAAALKRLLGDVPIALRAVARSTTDADDGIAETVRWAALEPASLDGVLESLELSIRRSRAEQVEAAGQSLLAPSRAEPRVLMPLLRAIELLTEASPVRAAALAIRGAGALGHAGHPLRERALELARDGKQSDLVLRALEAQLSRSTVDRLAALEQIADFHRSHGDMAGEARTWLRLLASAPREPKAISRLVEIYAEAGEHERLMAALSVQAEEGASAWERTLGHYRSAIVAARTLHEEDRARIHVAAAETAQREVPADELARPDRAAELLVHHAHVRAALGDATGAIDELLARAKDERDESALAVTAYEQAIALTMVDYGDQGRAADIAERGLKHVGTRGRLMRLFEQLALDQGDVARAERVYATLMTRSMGQHGRRALAYRRARWLERAGAKGEAVDAFVEACEHAASAGAVLSSLERVAREVGAVDSLARGLRALARNASHPAVRFRLVTQAARVYEDELGAPDRAFTALFEIWEKTTPSELDNDLARLSAALTARAPEIGAAALKRVVSALEQRASGAWTASEKAWCLRRIARIVTFGGRGIAEAEPRIREATQALVEDQSEPDTIVEPLLELASWYAQLGDVTRQRELVRDALATAPESERAREEAERLGLAPRSAGQRPSARPPSRPPIPIDTIALTDVRHDGPRRDARPKSEPPARASSPGSVVAPGASAHSPGFRAPHAAPTASDVARHSSVPPRPDVRAPSDRPHDRVSPDRVSPDRVSPDRLSPDRTPSDRPPSPRTASDRPLRPEPRTSLASEGFRRPSAPPAEPDARRSTPPREPQVARSAPTVRESQVPPEPSPSPTARASTPPRQPTDAAPARLSQPPEPQGASTADEARVTPVEAVDSLTEARRLSVLADARARAAGVDHFRAAIVASPHRLDIVRELANADTGPAGRLALSLLAVVSDAAPVRFELDVDDILRRKRELFLHPSHAPAHRLLQRLWEGAGGLFRLTLPQLGIVGTDRIGAHDPSIVGRTLADVGRLELGDIVAYTAHRPGTRVVVLRTQPPSLWVGDLALQNEAELRFELGRGALLTRPEHVLLATLLETDGPSWFEAVRGAFGTTSGPFTAKETATKVAELWRAVPPLVQREIRPLLDAASSHWDFVSLRIALFAGASRAGLVASRDVGAALRAARGGAPGDAPATVEAWSDEIARDAILADIVRFAFTDAFVAAVR